MMIIRIFQIILIATYLFKLILTLEYHLLELPN